MYAVLTYLGRYMSRYITCRLTGILVLIAAEAGRVHDGIQQDPSKVPLLTACYTLRSMASSFCPIMASLDPKAPSYKQGECHEAESLEGRNVPTTSRHLPSCYHLDNSTPMIVVCFPTNIKDHGRDCG